MQLKFIIVLGQSLLQNDVMRISLVSRIDTAMKIYNNLTQLLPIPNCRIILSGGVTGSSNSSEAKVMKNYICKHNLFHNSVEHNTTILLEEQSLNTIENAIHCHDIIKCICFPFQSNASPPSVSSSVTPVVIIVSNDFHIPRVKCIFKAVFESQSNYKLLFQSSPSYLNKRIYRSDTKLRPRDIEEWSFLERLEIESKAINNLHNQFKQYDLYRDSHTNGTSATIPMMKSQYPSLHMITSSLEEIELLKEEIRSLI